MSIGIDKLNPTYIHLRVRAQNSIGQGLDPELTSLDNARPKTGNDNIIAGNAHLSQPGNGDQDSTGMATREHWSKSSATRPDLTSIMHYTS